MYMGNLPPTKMKVDVGSHGKQSSYSCNRNQYLPLWATYNSKYCDLKAFASCWRMFFKHRPCSPESIHLQIAPIHHQHQLLKRHDLGTRCQILTRNGPETTK